jgi:hypothetical protein
VESGERGGDHKEDVDVDGRIIVKRMLAEKGGVYRLDWSCSGQGHDDSCEHGTKPSRCIKCREIFK